MISDRLKSYLDWVTQPLPFIHRYLENKKVTPEQVKEVEEELGLNVKLPVGVVYAQMISDLIKESGYDFPQINESQDEALPKVYNALKALLDENERLKGKK